VLADPPEGHLAVNAAAADNYLGRPTVEAVEEFFGERPSDCSLSGETSALSTDRAAEAFDWTPDHEWRAARDESVASPALVA
jgi:hypothetical protein